VRYPSPLLEGVLLGRRQRFFADVRLRDGTVVVAMCANTGSLRGVLAPGQRVRLSLSPSPGRRFPWTWEQARVGRTWVGVNTAVPNRAVEEALRAGTLPCAEGRGSVRREVPFGRENSRVDFVVEGGGLPPLALEVKNVSMAERDPSGRGMRALFPDSVTERGRKHLRELAAEVRAGRAGAVLFFVHRADCSVLAPADAVDPAYGRALRWAARQGVRVLAHRAVLGARSVRVGEAIPVDLAPGLPNGASLLPPKPLRRRAAAR
jgi:sugar fermentation stimulation protein A